MVPDEPCERCGNARAAGYARINGRRYCHGDQHPSCYEQQSHDDARRHAVQTGFLDWLRVNRGAG